MNCDVVSLPKVYKTFQDDLLMELKKFAVVNRTIAINMTNFKSPDLSIFTTEK